MNACGTGATYAYSAPVLPVGKRKSIFHKRFRLLKKMRANIRSFSSSADAAREKVTFAEMHPLAERFFEDATQWHEAFQLMREIVLAHKPLDEDFKWGHPCYTVGGKNVVLIHGFKEYCALLFMKGALLKDPKKILVQQTRHVQSARQVRITHIDEIKKHRAAINALIKEAIEVEKAGKKVTLKKIEDYPVPPELKKALQADKALKKSFDSLTPGRQKGYLFYFNQARRPKTREARIEKYYQQIMDGKGLHD